MAEIVDNLSSVIAEIVQEPKGGLALAQLSRICRNVAKFDTLKELTKESEHFGKSFWQCDGSQKLLELVGYRRGQDRSLFEIEEPDRVLLTIAADLMDDTLDSGLKTKMLRINRFVLKPEEQKSAASIEDAAAGAYYGLLLGDSIGSFLEFSSPTLEDADEAMLMPGGGPFRLAAGQITDDGELAMCLAQGLCESSAFDLDAIATMYYRWYRSNPFDIGGTCRNAFALRDSDRDSIGTRMTNQSLGGNMGSKANGAMMRSTPLAVWAHKLNDNEIATIAQQECQLSHPNRVVVEAQIAYLLAVAHLISHPGDRSGAYARAINWAKTNGGKELKEWIDEVEQLENVAYGPQIGFVKIGFVHALRHLQLGTSYEDAIRETIAGGGDTDTNAAIVGGMVGAYCGASNIKPELLQKLNACVPRHHRPEWLHGSTAPKLLKKLLAVAPDHL